jgi:SHS2 domain-containing protein
VLTEAGHRQVEHTADLALELWGPNDEALLEQGALGLVEILTGGAMVPPTEERAIDIEVVDEADRLVRWLNEVLWLASVEGFVMASVTFDLADPRRLRAHMLGDVSTPVVEEIKSATYHDLAIVRRAREETGSSRLEATVVLDV